MATSIGNSTSAHRAPPAPAVDQQRKVSSKDQDGDQDQSKAQEVEKPKATSGSVGTNINTTA